MDTQHDRTLAEAVMDVRTGFHFGELNERFWQHIDTGLNLIGALGGSAAVSSLFAPPQNGTSTLSIAAGVLMATVSVLQLVLRPSQKAVEFRDAKRAFAQLDADAWDLTLPAVDQRLRRLQAESPAGFHALLQPAQNRCLKANGHPERVRPLSPWQHLAMLLA